jgi:hypothetical protein
MRCSSLFTIAAALALSATPGKADDASVFTAQDLKSSPRYDYKEPSGLSYQGGYAAFDYDPVSYYFATWFQRVDEAQRTQPNWITPLVTVTPRLEEEYRYDYFHERLGNGNEIDNYGGGKGLELIPTVTNEIILAPPPSEVRSGKEPAAGWGDDPFFLLKQRLISANKDDGDYIVTVFLGAQAPTGVKAFTNDSWLITPTLAAGKGWGDFDIQATVGVALPTDHQNIIGDAVISNVTFQYHFGEYFWPEFEINDTYWSGGLRDGKNQVFITPGIVLGRFQLDDRAKLIVGAGYQIAVAPSLTKEPALTPLYQEGLVVTARIAF